MRKIFWALFAIQLIPAMAASAQEKFEIACPATTGPFVVPDGVPAGKKIADRAINKRWYVKVKTSNLAPPVWRKLFTLPPRYDGVVLKCKGRAGTIPVEASAGLRRTKCQVDQRRKIFLCQKY